MKKIVFAFLIFAFIFVSCAPSVDECREWAKKGDYDKAIKGYEKIINGKYDKDFEITKELLKLYEEKYPAKAFRIAKNLYKKDKGYKPLYERELIFVFDSLDAQKDFYKSANIVKELIKINPYTKRWRYVMIRTLVNIGDFNDAFAVLDTLEEMGDSLYRIDFYRGNINLASGNVEKAKKLYKKSLKENADYLPPHLALIRLLLEERKTEEAKQKALALVEKYPDYPEVYQLIADIYVAQGDYNKAVPYIDKYNELTKAKVYKSKWYMDIEN